MTVLFTGIFGGVASDEYTVLNDVGGMDIDFKLVDNAGRWLQCTATGFHCRSGVLLNYCRVVLFLLVNCWHVSPL